VALEDQAGVAIIGQQGWLNGDFIIHKLKTTQMRLLVKIEMRYCKAKCMLQQFCLSVCPFHTCAVCRNA